MKISLTKEALDVLRLMRAMDDDAQESDLIVRTRTGQGNTATNLEHRMATIFRNAGLQGLKGGPLLPGCMRGAHVPKRLQRT